MGGKRILILNSSPRKGGNSSMLAEAFARGAERSGHAVTTFNTSNTRIEGCKACNQCFSKGAPCVFEDDFNRKVAPLLEQADILVLSAPLYWFTFPATLKAALDKVYAYLVGKKKLPIQACALLTCGVAQAEREYDGIIRTYEIIAHYMHWENVGKVVVPGMRNIGDIFATDGVERAEKLGLGV